MPAGRGKASFIDARDIATVAALALTKAGHANRIYELTGGQALDYGQVATRLTEVLRRPIAYRHPGLLQFMRRQHAKGTPLTFAAVMAGIYTTARLGPAARLTDDRGVCSGARQLASGSMWKTTRPAGSRSSA